jgi:hypothetical protein
MAETHLVSGLKNLRSEKLDDSNEWLVSEQHVNVMSATEVWIERALGNCRLERHEEYLSNIKRMVTMCRTQEAVFIPPSWLPNNDAVALAQRMGVPGHASIAVGLSRAEGDA